MYYLYIEKTLTDTWYCFANDRLRTLLELDLYTTLAAPFSHQILPHTFLEATLLYSGPTIPTIDTHPEFFI